MKSYCNSCKKEKQVPLSGISAGLCKSCYKKRLWKPKSVRCLRCKRELPMHAKGLCKGCYSSIFHIDKAKAHSIQTHHHISVSVWKKITERCVICGFDKIVDLHHLDHNHENNTSENLIGLCPNHHRMLHDRRNQREVLDILQQKGFKCVEKYEDDKIYQKSTYSS